ncbi:MAG: helix-turn-helix domain-containing protein [Rhizomicrobium sp.]
MTAISARIPILLDVLQVAERVGVSTKTVRGWIKGHELHFHRLGRRLRVSEEDLVAFSNLRRE